nr:uncharacterized protein LOC109152041 [Ipomoea trifida]
MVGNCKRLMESLEMVRVIHVLRKGNKCANMLANLGQHDKNRLTIYEIFKLVLVAPWPLSYREPRVPSKHPTKKNKTIRLYKTSL